MPKLFKVTNIKYDWSNGGDTTRAYRASIPKKFYIVTDDPDTIADTISDKTGWCIEDLKIQEVAVPVLIGECQEEEPMTERGGQVTTELPPSTFRVN